MLRKISSGISILFHPVFHFFYVSLYFLLLSERFIPYSHLYNKWILLAYIFANTVVIPLLLVFFITHDFRLEKKEKRLPAYLLVIVVYITIYFFLRRQFLFRELTDLMLCMVIGLGFVTLLNFFLKVSLHSSGIAVIVSFFLFYPGNNPGFFLPVFISCILAGMIGSARLYLGSHTVKEITTGYIAGLLTGFFLLTI